MLLLFTGKCVTYRLLAMRFAECPTRFRRRDLSRKSQSNCYADVHDRKCGPDGRRGWPDSRIRPSEKRLNALSDAEYAKCPCPARCNAIGQTRVTDTRNLNACRARVRYKACLSGWLPRRSWAIPPCAKHIRLEKICGARATRISQASRALKEKQAPCRESMPQCVNDNAALRSTRDDPKRIVCRAHEARPKNQSLSA